MKLKDLTDKILPINDSLKDLEEQGTRMKNIILEVERQGFENWKIFEKSISELDILVPWIINEKLLPIDNKFLIVFS